MTNIDAYSTLLNNMTPWELLRLEANTPKEAALLTALAKVLEYVDEPIPSAVPPACTHSCPLCCSLAQI
jgi:hypothetical protein